MILLHVQRLILCLFAAVLPVGPALALPSSADVKRRLEKARPSTPRALHLSIIGDSISAGALAATQLGSQPSPELIGGIMAAVMARDIRQFLTATLSPDSAYPDAAGDWSLRHQLLAQWKIPESKLTLENASVPGRSMAQVTDKLLNTLESPRDKNAAHYILVELGSNDFCQGEGADAFVKSTAAALRRIEQKFPKARIFLAAVPPIYQLKDLGQEPILGQVTCETVQRLYCDRIYASDAKAINTAFNEGLTKLVAKSERTTFVSLPSDLTLDTSLLAVDCFHPGAKGHKKLAAAISSQLETSSSP